MVRNITQWDYKDFCDWWGARGAPKPAIDALPPLGFIVPDLCACFVYETPSTVAILEWVVGNPNSDKDLRNQALDEMLAHVFEALKSRGYKHIFTTTPHGKIIERYQSHGFKVTDTNCSNLMRSL